MIRLLLISCLVFLVEPIFAQTASASIDQNRKLIIRDIKGKLLDANNKKQSKYKVELRGDGIEGLYIINEEGALDFQVEALRYFGDVEGIEPMAMHLTIRYKKHLMEIEIEDIRCERLVLDNIRFQKGHFKLLNASNFYFDNFLIQEIKVVNWEKYRIKKE